MKILTAFLMIMFTTIGAVTALVSWKAVATYFKKENNDYLLTCIVALEPF